MYIFVVFTHHRINEHEWIYNWTLMLLKDFRVSLVSFQLIYFRNSFCYRVENSWSFKYEILSHVGPLRENFTHCVPWVSWNFRIFWAFCSYWSCPTQNLSATLWIMHLLQILKKLWNFIIQVTKVLKQTLIWKRTKSAYVKWARYHLDIGSFYQPPTGFVSTSPFVKPKNFRACKPSKFSNSTCLSTLNCGKYFDFDVISSDSATQNIAFSVTD